jgi:hypothetical protein
MYAPPERDMCIYKMETNVYRKPKEEGCGGLKGGADWRAVHKKKSRNYPSMSQE